MTRDDAIKCVESQLDGCPYVAGYNLVYALEALGILKFSPWTAPPSHPAPADQLTKAADILGGAFAQIITDIGHPLSGKLSHTGARYIGKHLADNGYQIVRVP